MTTRAAIMGVLLFIMLTSPLGVPQYAGNYDKRISAEEPMPAKIYGEDLSGFIFSQFSAIRFKDLIKEISQNGSREVGSLNNLYARKWIMNKLNEVSNNRIEIEVLGGHQSIVGRLPGWLEGNHPALMVGGHYDSVSEAPGANDDGTGVITMLEVARVMSQFNWPLDIYFCAWNAEEIGLVGSSEVANIFIDREIELLQYYNVDMLLVEDKTVAPDERLWFVYNNGDTAEYAESHYYADLAKVMSNNLGMNLVKPIPSNSFFAWGASDHASFASYGYDNILFAFESGFDYDDAYHTSDDSWDNPSYNYTLAKETVSTISASMAHVMSGAFGELLKFQFMDEVSEGNDLQYFFVMSTRSDISYHMDWSGGKIRVEMMNDEYSNTFTMSHLGSAGEYQETIDEMYTDPGLWKVIVSTDSSNVVEFNLTISVDSDFNTNGVLDSEEFWLAKSLFEMDNDMDGLSNGMEMIIGTSPWLPDTDSDGMDDEWEFNNHLNPLLNDSALDFDRDGLSNLGEYKAGTDPWNLDSDSDLMPDGFEVEYGLDPLNDDASQDFDGDGVSNLEEYLRGTDPSVSDIDITIPIVTAIAIVVVLFAVVLWSRRNA